MANLIYRISYMPKPGGHANSFYLPETEPDPVHAALSWESSERESAKEIFAKAFGEGAYSQNPAGDYPQLRKVENSLTKETLWSL